MYIYINIYTYICYKYIYIYTISIHTHTHTHTCTHTNINTHTNTHTHTHTHTHTYFHSQALVHISTLQLPNSKVCASVNCLLICGVICRVNWYKCPVCLEEISLRHAWSTIHCNMLQRQRDLLKSLQRVAVYCASRMSQRDLLKTVIMTCGFDTYTYALQLPKAGAREVLSKVKTRC